MLEWIRADRAGLNSLSMAHLLLWFCAKSITGVLTISKTACRTLRSFYEEKTDFTTKIIFTMHVASLISGIHSFLMDFVTF